MNQPNPPSDPLPPPPVYRRAIKPFSRRVRVALVAAAAVALGVWLLGTPPGLEGKADAIGYAICHQIAARSFLVNGEPLPLCARCTGTYLGVMAGLAVLGLSDRRRSADLPPNQVLVVLAGFVMLMGLDGVNSFLHLFPGYSGPYEPSNPLRLLTGSLAGLAMIALVLPVFNASVWARPEPARSVRSLRELGGMVLVILLVDAVVLLENPTALLVLGLISAAGPVVMLTLVWAVLFLSLLRRENTARTRRDLIAPLAAGLLITLLMIGGIDALRLALTGSWAGFDVSALRPGG